MKNIEQIKRLIVRCYKKALNIGETSITIFKESYKGAVVVSWSRIDTSNIFTPMTTLSAVYIYSKSHIAFNLSSDDTVSIAVYGSMSSLKIQTSFKNDSSRLLI